jgi:hypothetical protein
VVTYEEYEQVDYDDPDSMKKRIREIAQILSGDTSDIGDGAYLQLWSELEELEEASGYQFRRRARRSSQSSASVPPRPLNSSGQQVATLEELLREERNLRRQADSESRRLAEQLFNGRSSNERTRRVNEELVRQRRDLEALLEQCGTPEAFASLRQQAEQAEAANDELRELLAERDNAREDAARSLTEQVCALQGELEQVRGSAVRAAFEAEDLSANAAAASAAREAQLALEVAALREEIAVIEATSASTTSGLDAALERAVIARASAEEAAATLRHREQHIIALSESLTSRDAEGRRLDAELRATRQVEEALREDLLIASRQLNEREALITTMEEQSRSLSERNLVLTSQLDKCAGELAIAEEAGLLIEKAIDGALNKRQQERLRREIRALQPRRLRTDGRRAELS